MRHPGSSGRLLEIDASDKTLMRWLGEKPKHWRLPPSMSARGRQRGIAASIQSPKFLCPLSLFQR